MAAGRNQHHARWGIGRNRGRVLGRHRGLRRGRWWSSIDDKGVRHPVLPALLLRRRRLVVVGLLAAEGLLHLPLALPREPRRVPLAVVGVEVRLPSLLLPGLPTGMPTMMASPVHFHTIGR